MLHLEVSAYTSDQHLFQTAGTAFVTGRTGQWDIVAWTEGPVTTPLWQTSDFNAHRTIRKEEFEVDLNANLPFTIDLSGLNVGESFTLRTIASASVMTTAAWNPGALATLVDPLHADGANIRTRGLTSIADPLLESPPTAPPHRRSANQDRIRRPGSCNSATAPTGPENPVRTALGSW